MQAISLEGSYNTRGIGPRSAPRLVRTAALDALTAEGERVLRAHGADLVLDLREPSERGGHDHGLPVRSIPLYGSAPPVSGTLEDVYARLIADRGDRLAAAVVAIAEHPGTVVVHCTAGKDRTGLVVALTRLAARHDPHEIFADYALSGAAVRTARSGLVAARLDALGLAGAERRDAERLHLDSPVDALATALQRIEFGGGIDRYLLAHGAAPEHLAALARRLSWRSPSRAGAAGETTAGDSATAARDTAAARTAAGSRAGSGAGAAA